MRDIFSEFGGGSAVSDTFPLLTFKESMLLYGTDKPDLRNPIRMERVSEHFRGSGFRIFASLLENEGNEIRAIPALGGGSRRFLRPHECLCPKAGPAGDGLHLLASQGWRD